MLLKRDINFLTYELTETVLDVFLTVHHELIIY